MIELTKGEKDLVTSATGAANRLVSLWGYLTQGRANRADLESARECIRELTRFERLLETKLKDTVKLEDETEKPGSGCATKLDGPFEGDFRGKTFVSFFKRFFCGNNG